MSDLESLQDGLEEGRRQGAATMKERCAQVADDVEQECVKLFDEYGADLAQRIKKRILKLNDKP